MACEAGRCVRMSPLGIALNALQTIFYPNSKAKASEAMAVPLRRGVVLLHRFVLYHIWLPLCCVAMEVNVLLRHGDDCLLHEGSQVRSGTKYVLRSDIMFMN